MYICRKASVAVASNKLIYIHNVWNCNILDGHLTNQQSVFDNMQMRLTTFLQMCYEL